MSKPDLRARPMFARTRDAIEAHLTIVFTALAIARAVQDRTGLSLRRVLRTLRPLRSANVEINGVITTIPPALSPEETAILNALESPPQGTKPIDPTQVIGANPGQVFCTGLTVYNGDEAKGIQLYEGGHYGWKTTDWIANALSTRRPSLRSPHI